MDKLRVMDKKDLLRRIVYSIKDIESTGNRLGNTQEEMQDLELALLTQQVVKLYGQLKQYPSIYNNTATTSVVKEVEKIPEKPAYTAPTPTPVANTEAKAIPIETVAPIIEKPAPAIVQNMPAKEEPTPVVKQEALVAEKPVPEPVPEKPQAEPVVTRPEPVIIEAPKTVVFDTPAVVWEPAPQPVAAEKDTEEIKEPEIVETVIKTKKPISSKLERLKSDEQSLNEKLYSPQVSLNERLAGGNVKRNLADKLKLSPISDLRSALSINQKAAFISKLFNGEEKEFKRVLNFISESRNFSEAKYYLQSEIGKQYNWQEDNEVVQEFMELVYRKFL